MTIQISKNTDQLVMMLQLHFFSEYKILKGTIQKFYRKVGQMWYIIHIEYHPYGSTEHELKWRNSFCNYGIQVEKEIIESVPHCKITTGSLFQLDISHGSLLEKKHHTDRKRLTEQICPNSTSRVFAAGSKFQFCVFCREQ